MSKLDERAKLIATKCRTVGSHEAHDVICELLDKLFVTEDQRDVAVLSEQEMAMTEGLIRDERDAATKRVAELEEAVRDFISDPYMTDDCTCYSDKPGMCFECQCYKAVIKALSPKQEGGG